MYSRSLFKSIKRFHVNPIIKVLIFSDFIIWSSYNLLAPVFAIFIVQTIPGAGVTEVGIAAALYFVFKSLLEIPVGMYIDKTKSEKDDLFVAFLGTIVASVVYFMYASVGSIGQLYALQALLGVSAALAFPGWYSLFSNHLDKNHVATEWSLYDVMIGIGMAVSAALGGFIVEEFSFAVLFMIISAVSFVGALLLLLLRGLVRQR